MIHRPPLAIMGSIPEVKTGPEPGREFTRYSSIADARPHVAARRNAPTGEGPVNAVSTMETPKVTPLVPDSPKSKEDKAMTETPFTPIKGDRGIKKLFAKFKRKPKHSKEEKSFAGGAALTNITSNPAPTGLHEYDSSSINSLLESDVEEDDGDRERPESGVSEVTEGSDEFEEARDVFDEGLVPPPMYVIDEKKTGSPVRDTRFHEEF
jgi:hypothetical protein